MIERKRLVLTEQYFECYTQNKRSCNNVLTFAHECFILYSIGRCSRVKKSISISIRVSEEELDKFKQAARLEAYASYSEFVRRTALIEAAKIIKKNKCEGIRFDEYN